MPDDPQIVAAVYEARARRRPTSRSCGRLGTPAEVVLRLLVLKHMRNWSYAVLEREVRAILAYRRWGVAPGPAVIKQIHERMVQLAREGGVVPGRRLRVDSTVVKTNTHYPTDSRLLGDGVRALIRTMQRIT